MAISPSKNQSIGSSTRTGASAFTQQLAYGVEIYDKARKRPREDDSPSMELGPPSPSINHGVTFPTSCFEESSPTHFHVQQNASQCLSQSAQRMTVTASDNSSIDAPPCLFLDRLLKLSRNVPHQQSLRSSKRSEPEEMSISDMCRPGRSSSLLFDRGMIPGPPSLIPQASSKCYLLGHPMIKSPGPRALLSACRPTGSLRRDLSSTTPLSENTFHPTMFTIESNSSTRAPYWDKAECRVGTTSGNHPLCLLRQSNSRLDQTEIATYSCAPSSRNGSGVFRCFPREAVVSVEFDRSTYTPPHTIKPSRRFHASQLLRFAASQQDRHESSDPEETEEIIVCTCPRSKCLKLYCVCFQRGVLCNKSRCKCTNCKNTSKHDGPRGARTMAIESISKRRPNAFGKREKPIGLGCSCKRNKCLKKYCACLLEGTPCDETKCGCLNCHNQPRTSVWFSGSPLSMGSEL